jgi:ribosomal protein S18 acetylase RimI-like enzyme
VLMKLVPYEPSRRQQLLDVWNAGLGARFPLSASLFIQNAERDPHAAAGACWTALLPDGRTAGFCLTKIVGEPLAADGWQPNRGWISLLAVHPTHQRRGIGTALLARAEDDLRARGRGLITVGADPNHFLPGVPEGEGAVAFFRRAGYAFTGEAYDLHRPAADPLPRERLPASLRETDVTIRPLEAGDGARLFAFLDAVFPGRWRYGVERVLAHGGSFADLAGVIEEGRVVGFAQMFHPRSPYIGPSIAWTRHGTRAGGIGPIGLAPHVRGRGLGLALLRRCVEWLQRMGIEDVVVDWTSLVEFYGRLGFSVWRRYHQGDKRL